MLTALTMVKAVMARTEPAFFSWQPLSSLISIYCLLVGLLCLTLVSPSMAAEPLDTQKVVKQLSQYEKVAKRRNNNVAQLKDLASTVTALQGDVRRCVTDTEPQIEKLQHDLDSLGEPSAKDSPDVKRQRLDIKKQLTELERQLGTCKALILRSDDLLKAINDRIRDELAHTLMARGADTLTLLMKDWSKSPLRIADIIQSLVGNSGIERLDTSHWLILLVSLLMSVGAGMLVRAWLLKWIGRKSWHEEDFASGFILALLSTLACSAPYLLASGAAAILFYVFSSAQQPIPIITIIALGLPPYFLFLALVQLVLHPKPPAKLFLKLPEELAHSLARRFKMLAMLVFVGYLVFASLLAQSLPEPVILIFRSVFATVLILNLMWAVSLIMRLPVFAGRFWLIGLVHILLLASLIAEWMGYRNLSLTLIRDVVGSLLVLGIALLLLRLFRDFYAILESGNNAWSDRIRRVMGSKKTHKIPGLLWLRFLTGLAIWGSLGYILLLVWDVSDTIILEIRTLLTQGFAIGSLTIVPVKLAVALLTIALVILAGGWVRNRLENRWLKYTEMDRGAREALVTITGYVLFVLAFFIGLSVAGFEFQNLAIIAGALSVGIGFGLQNIVNNFISGLILLFERPIKTGDWIIVGDAEGYVRRIRIRSTQIQTFDRADVIVPNSELIANQVTNWMLKDERGRLRLSVGVAYGSDTERVREILMRVAAEHEDVVSDGSLPQPRVLFREFGDSSLNFELRAFIRNIDMRLLIISDLNFAIDKAFREAGIEIPFPQRDIHVRDMPIQHDQDNPEGGKA